MIFQKKIGDLKEQLIKIQLQKKILKKFKKVIIIIIIQFQSQIITKIISIK